MPIHEPIDLMPPNFIRYNTCIYLEIQFCNGSAKGSLYSLVMLILFKCNVDNILYKEVTHSFLINLTKLILDSSAQKTRNVENPMRIAPRMDTRGDACVTMDFY